MKWIFLEVSSEHMQEKKAVFENSQDGFLGDKSCLTGRVVFCGKITRYVDKGRAVKFVCITYSKAFYKVYHNTLLFGLEHCGLDS